MVKERTFEKNHKQPKNPLIHIVKRSSLDKKTAVIIRACAVAAGFILCSLCATLLTGESPLDIMASFFIGSLESMDSFLDFLSNTSVLLLIALAVTPAFKMRFWNCGAEGQVLIGGLACVACRYYFSDMPLVALIPLMLICSIAASVIWSVIPSIFKAIWNTNETLFTLMLNYIAMQLVAFCLKVWVKNGSGILGVAEELSLPEILGSEYLYIIIVAAAITVLAYIYLKYSKQGYEISVVGESENTAKYVGINVKKVIIRTLAISGIICGIAGFLIVHRSGLDIKMESVESQGFTAIMVSWLAKFNPVYMVLTSALVIFLQNGAQEMVSTFGFSNAVSEVVTSIMLLAIIGCEFFINYKVIFRKKADKEAVK